MNSIGLSAPHIWRTRRKLISLLALVIIAFSVRLVGITSGLPFAYNPDEELHFVPPAAGAADGDLDPDYFQNPSALTYLLAAVFRIVFVGHDVTDLLGTHPAAVYLTARLVVAALGALLVFFVYAVGCRYFGYVAGLGAAVAITFGFLPVHYSRQALNDVPTLLSVTVALGACLAFHERGRCRDLLLAGTAVGIATATKYTAAPLAIVVLLAVLLRCLEHRERPGRAFALLAGSGLLCLGAFLALNPYLVLDFDTARAQFNGQSAQAASGKLGQSGSAWTFYPVSLLWGLGAAPTLLALIGLVLALRAGKPHRARAVMLIAFPVILYIYMSTQDRFFARWLLPAYPSLAVLAGYGLSRVTGRLRESTSRSAAAVAPVLVVLVSFAQPIADTAHGATVVSHVDTRTQALAWIRENITHGERIVVEPSVPDDYLDGVPVATYPVDRPYQNYELSLDADLIDTYRELGYCLVMVNSFQRDRGLAAGLTGAGAYYTRLNGETDSRVVFSPYHADAQPPSFSYDHSFNWYPRAYERPGPYLEIIRLRDCRPG